MATIQLNLYSNEICKNTTIQILLPNDVPDMMKAGNPNYDREMKTLFLLHGYSGNCWDWLNGSLISDLSLRYNLAVVMPSGDNSFYLDAEASGNNYETYLTKELLEYVRKTFGIAKTPEDTFIGGLSMGGFGAIHSGLNHPDVFGKMFGLSSALIVNEIKDLKEDSAATVISNKRYYENVFGDLTKLDESVVNPEYLVKERLKAGDKIQPIFMACGSEDFLIENNRQFKNFLIENNVDVEYRESTGIHEWKFWNEYIEPAIQWTLDIEE